MPQALTIDLFGPIQVTVHGQPLPRLRSRKALWLLALLVLRNGRTVSRDWLANTLWPDATPSVALATLRPLLSELRRALGPEAERLTILERKQISLNLQGALVDVIEFDRAIKSKQYAAAVEIYKGELLESCTEEWVHQERNSREQDCFNALQSLAEQAYENNQYADAIAYFGRAIALDNWRDAPRRGLMKAFAGLGDVNAALQVYREYAHLLSGEAGLSPDERTTELYQQLRSTAQRPKQPTPQKSEPKSVKGNLPHALTELIGREDERTDVAALLRKARVVTLLGVGGIGKTRLSLAAAADLEPEFAGGAWFISFDAFTEGPMLAAAISTALGIRERQGQTLIATIAAHIGETRTLLVLDNCEHMLEAIATLCEQLLRESQGVRILMTSREALGLTGEQVWNVPPLQSPDPKHLPTGRTTLLRVLQGYESVRLFLDRAKLAQPEFQLTDHNALQIAQICATLEGVPLAIELVAARLRTMTLESIAERLQAQALGLLDVKARATTTRHQTLRATLSWSYNMLNPAEKLLLGRVAIFRGGWTLDAAEQVCEGNGLQQNQIADLLTSLTDKSLVAFDPQESGRYRLLEMVRQYADETTTEPEKERLRIRHREWAVALAETAEPLLMGVEQPQWIHRLILECGNLRWAMEAPNPDEYTDRLAAALWRYNYIVSEFVEGERQLTAALARASKRPESPLYATILHGIGVMKFRQGQLAESRPYFAQALEIRTKYQDQKGIAESVLNLANVAMMQGETDSATTLYLESKKRFEELGDLTGVSRCLNNLGSMALRATDLENAKLYYSQSKDIEAAIGNQRGLAWILNYLGNIALDQGQWVEAEDNYLQSLAMFEEVAELRGKAWCLLKLGDLALCWQADTQKASPYLQESLDLFQQSGDRPGASWALFNQANASLADSDLTEARRLFQQSCNEFKEMGESDGVQACLVMLGLISTLENNFPQAREELKEATQASRQGGSQVYTAITLDTLALIQIQEGNPQLAQTLQSTAHHLRHHSKAQEPKFLQTIFTPTRFELTTTHTPEPPDQLLTQLLGDDVAMAVTD